MLYELTEYYCIFISTLLLLISPIYSLFLGKYDFCITELLVVLTSILNHYKVYKYGRYLDLPVVWVTVIYHYFIYFKYYQSNILFLICWIIGKLLYMPSIYYNNNKIHSLMHIFFITGSILLNNTEIKVK